MEEYGLVLDYLPSGKSDDVRREPLANLVGERFFTLLEVVTKNDVKMMVGERVYIGKEMSLREKVDRIKNRIEYPQLTTSARSELKSVIKKIVIIREKEFVDFFNKCGPITIRQHQLELIPGIGKKHLTEMLNEREKKPFESLSDITNRIPHLQNPAELIAERIIEEMQGSRYYIFTRPPAPPGSLHPHSGFR